MSKQAKILIGLLVLAIAVFSIAASVFKSKKSETTLSQDNALFVRPDSAALGPKGAKVQLVEFLDPECESCSAFHPKVKELLKEFDGKILYVVRYMPYHFNSVLAASATEAAGAQGKYWEMQNLLFEKQREWGEAQTSQKDKILGYANELGLDMAKFEADLEKDEFKQKVDRDRADGEKVGVQGTPSFFVNQRPVFQLSDFVIRSMIQEELEK